MKILSLFSKSLVILLFLSSCTKSTPPAKNNQSIRVGIRDLHNLDWNKRRTFQGVTESIAEPLIKYRFKEGKITLEPALAEKWWSKKNDTQWFIKIRSNLKWSNGKPFLAESILHSLERILNPKTGSHEAFYFLRIKGAKDYYSGKITDFSKVGVSITKKGLIKFELEKIGKSFCSYSYGIFYISNL